MKLMAVIEKLRHFHPGVTWRLLQLTNHALTRDNQFLEVYWELVRDNRMIFTIREAYNLFYYTRRAAALDGAIAELGVYKGGSAKLISLFKGDLPFYLFDTFAGMPAVSAIDRHHAGDFNDTSLASVKAYLAPYPNLQFFPGRFPDSARDLPNDITYSFVHLDVDIYESTLAGLQYFYPRLKKGGLLLSHDYASLTCPGVKKAFDEYFHATPEVVMPLFDTQCLVAK